MAPTRELALQVRLRLLERRSKSSRITFRNWPRQVLPGEGYETPGKPPVASTPVTSRVGGNPPL
eukprot:1178145-Prorocentrum_minimum.AAC.6